MVYDWLDGELLGVPRVRRDDPGVELRAVSRLASARDRDGPHSDALHSSSSANAAERPSAPPRPARAVQTLPRGSRLSKPFLRPGPVADFISQNVVETIGVTLRPNDPACFLG
jgi:hypothetical protein